MDFTPGYDDSKTILFRYKTCKKIFLHILSLPRSNANTFFKPLLTPLLAPGGFWDNPGYRINPSFFFEKKKLLHPPTGVFIGYFLLCSVEKPASSLFGTPTHFFSPRLPYPWLRFMIYSIHWNTSLPSEIPKPPVGLAVETYFVTRRIPLR